MRRLVPLLLAIAACNGRLDQFALGVESGDGGTPRDATAMNEADSGTFSFEFAPVDILFVVDNSGSMADEQENLAANFASFADQVIGLVDYRIGVVTTDVDSPSGEMAGLAISTFSSTPPYALSGFDASGCMHTGVEHGCFRGSAAPLPIVMSEMDRETQIATFRENIRVGSCGHGAEKGLAAMLRALEQMQPGGCNEGFLREHANLLIIIVTDEDEASAMNIAAYVDALGTFKPWGQVRVTVIAGIIDGIPTTCSPTVGPNCGSLCASPPDEGSGTSCTAQTCTDDEYCHIEQGGSAGVCRNDALRYWNDCNWCSFYNTPDCCVARAATRYVDFALAVEQRVHLARLDFPIKLCKGLGTRVACLTDTICQESFGDTMARIARELVLVEP